VSDLARAAASNFANWHASKTGTLDPAEKTAEAMASIAFSLIALYKLLDEESSTDILEN
jgi:hypothetical protein